MIGAWRRLGLRGRLTLSIGSIVVFAFAIVFVAVRAQMSNESAVIRREESREVTGPGEGGEDTASPIADAHSDVEKTLFLAGGITLVLALLGGGLIASRTASPLRRFATTAAAVDGGDLTPRLDDDPRAASELRALAESFNHMLDRLEDAFSRQRQFVSDASHELRSPLTAVRGQLEVLARSEHPDPAEVRRVEAVTLAELGRVERLVESLLALARLDEGQGPALRPLDAASFVREIARAAPGNAASSELAEGRLEADPDLLARVVHNLIENARRHAGPAGRVELSSRAEGEGLVIRVDDDGPGIPPDEYERVFDRFHRSDSARDRAAGGSGLGLAISREIAAAHGGRIWAEGSPLGGARLCLELPRFEPR